MSVCQLVEDSYRIIKKRRSVDSRTQTGHENVKKSYLSLRHDVQNVMGGRRNEALMYLNNESNFWNILF